MTHIVVETTITINGEKFGLKTPVTLPDGTPNKNVLAAIKDTIDQLSTSAYMRAEFELFPELYTLLDPNDPSKGHIKIPTPVALPLNNANTPPDIHEDTDSV